MRMIIFIVIPIFLLSTDDVHSQTDSIFCQSGLHIPEHHVDKDSLYRAYKENPLQRYSPVRHTLSIVRIKRRYKKLYEIYGVEDDTLYKLVSYKDKEIKGGEAIKEGCTYKLQIQSIVPETFYGMREAQGIMIDRTYANYVIRKEPEKLLCLQTLTIK